MARPSSFDPDYCERVIEFGRKGKSRAWIAAELNVSRQTLHNWEKDFPEFLDAMDRAGVLAQQWWEDAGQSGMTSDKFSAPVWSRSMAARFPDDWREKQAVEHSGAVTVEIIRLSE
jgi:hypothetical protein